MLLASAINTEEVRDMAIIDTPNALIQSIIEGNKVIFHMRVNISEIMVTTASYIYCKYITTKRKEKL